MIKFILRVGVMSFFGWVTMTIALNGPYGPATFGGVVLAALIVEIIVALLLDMYTPLRGMLHKPIDWKQWG